MADVGSFLFGDKPQPLSITGESSTVSGGMPEWYQDYAKGIIGKAHTLAGESYTPYGGSRIAGLNEKDRQAGGMIQQNIGSWQPYLGQASRAYNTAMGMRGAEAASPLIEQSAGLSATGAASPLINQGAQGSGLAAASPFMSRASATWPSNMQEYMSPYTESVVNEIGRKGTQNLMENILPGVNNTFTGGGLFGSSRHADFTNKAIGRAAEEIAGQQAQALERGYGTSANIFGQDQSRLAGLGQTAGGLAGQDYGRMVDAGRALGGLTAQDAGNLANLANIKGTLTGQDATRVANIGNQLANLATTRASLGTGDAAAIAGLGDFERGLTQKELDMRYGDFERQRDYGWDQLNKLNSIFKGQQLPQTQTSTNVGAGTTGVSLANRLLGVGGLMGGLGGYY